MMPALTTLLRTKKLYTASKGEPLHQVSEKTEAINMGQGQALGHRQSHRVEAKGTPPGQDSRGTDLDVTPPAKAKVLPWVENVETGTEPDGMFGPYESLPPTRMPTMHETVPIPRNRPHPFAYNPDANLPFSAFADQEDVPMPIAKDPHVGAALRGVPTEQGEGGLRHSDIGSAGMGTFGLETRASPRKAATNRTGSPTKTPIQPVVFDSAQQSKAKSTASARKPVPAEQPTQDQPHLHKPHHDYPFSHAEAAQKQAEAMDHARAQALAQLEAARGEVADMPTATHKGPRGTFETGTSGPSFGHIHHIDGHPTIARQSYQQGITSVPMTRDVFRIPFGVPMSMSIPRPMMLVRTGTGAGMGIGLSGLGMTMPQVGTLEEVPEMSEPERKKDDRSAFFETIEDEEEPKTPRTKVKQHPTIPSIPSAGTGAYGGQTPARPESELNPQRRSEQTMRQGPFFQPVDPEQYPPQMSPVHEPAPRSIKAPTARSQTHTDATIISPVAKAPTQAQARSTPTVVLPPAGSHKSTSHVNPQQATPPSPVDTLRPSIAPTSATNVKKIVKDSSFHDETLCELLEAARLNLIGPEAKKALQRAARARVIELKDMREQEAKAAYPTPPSLKEKKSRSGVKRAHQSTLVDTPQVPPQKSPTVNDSAEPPAWAKQLVERMNVLDDRLAQLAVQQGQEMNDREVLMDDEVPADLINDLIFRGLPTSAFTSGLPPIFPLYMDQNFPSDSPQGARIRTMTPSHKARENSAEVTLTWGSEVELPSGVSPPKPLAPTINVQPPTESNARTRLASIPSRTDPRTPIRTEVELVDEQFIPGTGMAEKSLPDTPDTKAHSQRSQAPSPEAGRTPTARVQADYFSPQERAGTVSDATTPIIREYAPKTATMSAALDHPNGLSQHLTEPSVQTADAVTAPTHVTRPPAERQHARDVIHVKEASEAHEYGPWDHVTQRLYAWALVWEEESFVKALEALALGKQADVMPLTVFSMMTYKRLLNRNLTAQTPKACDKLFVPPIMADAINKAVHNKQIENAKQILEELWYTWGFKTPPRVVIALAKHRNEVRLIQLGDVFKSKLTSQNDKWTAHRFDLATGHLTSYGITSEEQNLPDGRPFMWWHAIRAAWPEYNIPDPNRLRQRVEYVITPWEEKNDNSIKALNYARNLLLGFRPELARDLGKLRETVWEEVKRVLHKKRSGHLVVHADRHGEEI